MNSLHYAHRVASSSPEQHRSASLSRRRFIALSATATLTPVSVHFSVRESVSRAGSAAARQSDTITLFLCGDVMTGRGIDQILPRPSPARLCEQYVKSARGYVELAERVNGPIPKPVRLEYIWGDALAELRRSDPDVRIVNLETAVTTSDDCVPKGINYRMHPENIGCITAAKINCCTLANNHVLDWGSAGLVETLETLERARVRVAGAGRDATSARAPAVVQVPEKGRVVVYAFGVGSSGIPRGWQAGATTPGVNRLGDLSERTVRDVSGAVAAFRRPGDITVASIHWGSNWGYRIPAQQQTFARALIDSAGIDIVHGHSSHHAKAIELYRGKPVLYGCGDFLNDYEGISGREEFRSDLVVMYLVDLRLSDRRVVELTMVPFRLRRFRLEQTSQADAQWLERTLDRECRTFGGRVERSAENRLSLAVD